MSLATAKKCQIILVGIASGLALLAVALFVRSDNAPDERADVAPPIVTNVVQLQDGSQLHVQRFELSVAEWNMCFDAGGCRQELRARGAWTEAETPATGLSYLDTQEFITWINGVSGREFRLPTLQEWEFMAAEVMPDEPEPIFTDPNLTWASAYLLEPQVARTLRPQGTFDVTTAGVADLNGSVWEWTQDCYVAEGQAAYSSTNCPAYYVGGEHVAAVPFPVRDPARGGCAVGAPPAHLGMRLVTARSH